MLSDILIILSSFALAVIFASFFVILYYLIKTRRITKKVPKNMDEIITRNKLIEQEVKNERETRRLGYELGRRRRSSEPEGELQERLREIQEGNRISQEGTESLQVDGTDERHSTSESTNDNDAGTDTTSSEFNKRWFR